MVVCLFTVSVQRWLSITGCCGLLLLCSQIVIHNVFLWIVVAQY